MRNVLGSLLLSTGVGFTVGSLKRVARGTQINTDVDPDFP